MVETAELAEHFQWLTQKQSKNLSLDKKEMIKDEIGDVMIYLVNLSDKLGIDPLQAAYDKGELFCAPCLFPGGERSLQGAQDNPQSGNQSGSLGHPQQ